jgi:hypothetical protein
MSLEQIVRSVLERAIEDGLVSPMESLDDPDPQCRTDDELRGCVMVLRERIGLQSGQPLQSGVPSPHWPRVAAET